MTKFAIALAAAALLAAPNFSSTAEAGGVRLGFGFPLGSFVARPHQSYDSAPSYRAQKRVAKKPAAARAARTEEAAVRKAHKPKAKVEIAEKAPVKRYRTPAMVKTAKIENKSVVSDAAPTIRVPVPTAVVATPEVAAATPEVKTTETTPVVATETTPVTTQTAAVEPAPAAAVQDVVKVEEPKTETVATTVKEEPKVSVSSKAKRVCRRFSAAVAGLIDIPCE